MIRPLLFLSLLLSSAQPLLGASRDLTILSYNIHGLDSAIGGNSRENLRAISHTLQARLAARTAPDLVLLQEVFSGPAKKAIRQLSGPGGFPYAVFGPRADGRVYGSGLVILSRHPIRAQASMSFGKVCKGADCYANKGALLVRVQVDGLPRDIVVLNTHLQAHAEHDTQRRLQMSAMTTFLAKQGLGDVPFFLAGDLNTNPGRKSFEYLRALMPDLENSGAFCLRATGPCTIEPGTPLPLVLEKSKDQIFYFPRAGPLQVTPQRLMRRYSEEIDGLPYSDHATYEVRYRLSW